MNRLRSLWPLVWKATYLKLAEKLRKVLEEHDTITRWDFERCLAEVKEKHEKEIHWFERQLNKERAKNDRLQEALCARAVKQ